MINETGANLSVVILTEPGKDWETFSTWYSFWKNLPDARTILMIERNGTAPFSFYQWSKRLNVFSRVISLNKAEQISPDINQEDGKLHNFLSAVASPVLNQNLQEKILVIKPLAYSTELLESSVLNIFNNSKIYWDGSCLFLSGQNREKLLNDFWIKDWRPELQSEKLFIEAKDFQRTQCLVSCDKGCGKWIHTAKGCPFSNAGGLVTDEMTANEHRIIELWRKMVTLYNSVI